MTDKSALLALAAKWEAEDGRGSDPLIDSVAAEIDAYHDCAAQLRDALAQAPAEGDPRQPAAETVDRAFFDRVRAVFNRINRRLEESNMPVGHALVRSWESDLQRALCAAAPTPPAVDGERGLLDAKVVDSLIVANEETHAVAKDLAACLADAVAAGATDIPLTHRAGGALKRYEELAAIAQQAAHDSASA